MARYALSCFSVSPAGAGVKCGMAMRNDECFLWADVATDAFSGLMNALAVESDGPAVGRDVPACKEVFGELEARR